MDRRRANTKKTKTFTVEENLQIAVQKEIDDFINDDELMHYSFPASLTNIQRGYIHTYVQLKGLKSKSSGKGRKGFH